MGSSHSLLFTYRDHHLVKKNGKFLWVWSKTDTELVSMKVIIKSGPVTRENYATLRQQIGTGPLIVQRGSDYSVLLEDYVPRCEDPSLTYYKITSKCRHPSWTQTFYIRKLN